MVMGLIVAMGAMVVSQSSRSRALSTDTSDLSEEPLPFSRLLSERVLMPARSANVCWSMFRLNLSFFRLSPT